MEEGEWAFQSSDLCKNKLLFVIEGEYKLSPSAQKRELYGATAFDAKDRLNTFEYGCQFLTDGKIAITTIDDIEESLGYSLAKGVEKR